MQGLRRWFYNEHEIAKHRALGLQCRCAKCGGVNGRNGLYAYDEIGGRRDDLLFCSLACRNKFYKNKEKKDGKQHESRLGSLGSAGRCSVGDSDLQGE
jgi:hypothetical protein